jgi:hypothetical protein
MKEKWSFAEELLDLRRILVEAGEDEVVFVLVGSIRKSCTCDIHES